MCEKFIYHEEFHTLFSVLKIKQWPADNNKNKHEVDSSNSFVTWYYHSSKKLKKN